MLNLLVAVGLLIAPESSDSVMRGTPVRVPVADCPVALPSCGMGGYDHYATAGYGSGGQTHGECMLCQEYGSPTDPTQCHKCIIELNEVEQLAYDKLLAAGRAGDVARVVKLAAAISKRVVYNRERGAIQIKAACDVSTVVASLKVQTDEQRRIAMTLPGVETAMRGVMVGLR